MDPWGRAALGLGLALVLLAYHGEDWRDRQPPWGGAALAAIGALQVFSPLFSLQYTIWLLPWVATTAQEEGVSEPLLPSRSERQPS